MVNEKTEIYVIQMLYKWFYMCRYIYKINIDLLSLRNNSI